MTEIASDLLYHNAEGKLLTGFEFHCNAETEQGCIDFSVFGSPEKELSLLQSSINPFETLLFLKNLTTKKYYNGIFVATCKPNLNICKKVNWHKRFKAQVFVKQICQAHNIRRSKNKKSKKIKNEEVQQMIAGANIVMGRDVLLVGTTKHLCFKRNTEIKSKEHNKTFDLQSKIFSIVSHKTKQNVQNKFKTNKKLRAKPEPITTIKRKINLLINQKGINIRENPFLIIDAYNIAAAEEAPNNKGKAIATAMKDLMEDGYGYSNILFSMPIEMDSECTKCCAEYKTIKERYPNSFHISTNKKWFFLDVLVQYKRMLPIVISNRTFRLEKADLEKSRNRVHSNWLQNFTENRVFNYRWFGMIFYLDANTPPPQLLETNVLLGSFNYVFPQHERYRQECMEKIISYIGEEVAKKFKDLKDKISSAKEMDELDRKIQSLDLYKKKNREKNASKVLSNWIFDCSREGALCQKEDEQWTHAGKKKNMKNSLILHGKDRMLPDRNESNKTDFLKRLRSQFDVEYPVEWGEKLYSEIMLCIEKTKAKIQQDAKSRVDKGRVFVHHNNNHLKRTRLEYIPFNKNRESSFITMFTKYYHKLERDHNKATICTDDKKIIYRYANYDNRTPLFLKRIFSMMQRYHTLWHKNSGAHGALPDEVFHALKTNLKVEGECFASPLNHRLPKFYSAFPDTDRCFGSLGSFFDKDNNQMTGSWEANPPFDISSVKNTLEKIRQLLENAERRGDNLSFAVFFGHFGKRTKVGKELKKLKIFQRGSIRVEKDKHAFLYGFQHQPQFSKNGNKHWRPERDTDIYLFQTSSTFSKYYNADKKKVKKILEKVKASFDQPLK